MASSGAVATPHFQATSAGERVLADGGSAVDAAIAAAAVLAVVAPDQCGIGGDAVALVGDAAGEVTCFQGAGRAPQLVDVAAVRRAGAGVMPRFGPHAVTVPGALSTWGAMHRHAGRLPWQTLFEPALVAASEGFAVGSRLHGSIVANRARLRADPGLCELLLPEGSPLDVVARLQQPELAGTLGTVAAEGPAAMYGGDLGARLVEFLRGAGSVLSVDDLARHWCDRSPPVATEWSGTRLWTAPPPSQGLTLFQVLAAMARAPGEPEWLGKDAGRLASVFAGSSRYREATLADPAGRPELSDVSAWLAADDLPTWEGATRPDGDTVAVVAADDAGCFVSLIFSLFYGFGAGLRDPGTGVVFHNRGAGFTLAEASPNCLAPGRRPAHSLMPLLAARDGALVGAHGTMGGYGQPQIHAQLLLRLASGMEPQDAVTAPRFVVGRPDAGGPLQVFVEETASVAALESIEGAGMPVQLLSELDHEVGHAQLVRRSERGGLATGTDPRADGRPS
jgi:gamma-glutamyltranspeptidase/glutathione hydrolase